VVTVRSEHQAAYVHGEVAEVRGEARGQGAVDVAAEPEPEPEVASDAREETGTEAVRAELPQPEALVATEPVEVVADHTCNSADFERPLCATCGGLHWYCSICGAQRDACRTATVAG
jgi:hypothetical protein